MADPEMTDPHKGPEPEYKVERPKPKMTRQQKLGMGALLAGASLAALWTVWPSSRSIPDVETSAVEEFQDQAGGSPFGAIEPRPEVKPNGDEFSDIEGELASQREDLEARNATLQSEVERLQRELGDLADRADAEKDQTAKELALALEEAQSQNLALMEDMRRQFDQEIAILKAGADTTGAAEAQREAELAAKRAEREAQLAARVASPSVVFDDGQKSGAGDAGMGMAEAPAEGRDATGRDFVQSGREATATEVSQVIASPSNTVLQGTMIEATLENAVDSSLPGQITAIVTRPVWSFDQLQILIPAGSRLFGDYSSDVAIGQGRILVAWTRLVTPDGQSVQMEAFGGDAQGRSGITGKVNTRFGARFGSAALISLLGAAPAIAAAKYTDEISSDTAESMGEDLSAAMGSAVESYTSLPPIITVAPGAAITVMVDRDLEIW
ncbi:MAG: TrbI/VirB10 family protein [Tabrizicola sp.]|nr:TrbI/VirB10 family protein [Tabrizicola sp.]